MLRKVDSTLVESAAQIAMRVVRDEIDVTRQVTHQQMNLLGARVHVAPTSIARAVAVKRFAPELMDGVISGEVLLNPAYDRALTQRRVVRKGHTSRERQHREKLVQEMAIEGYADEDIAAATGYTIEVTRGKLHQLGFQSQVRKTGRGRRLDSDRIMDALVAAAEPSLDAISTLDFGALDTDKLAEWQSRLSSAIRQWTQLRNRLRRVPRG